MLGVCLGLCASVCWGFADFLGGLEARRLPGMVVVLCSQAFGVTILATLVLVGGGLSIGGEDLLAACVAGLSGALGLSCFYRALSVGVMSIVAPITATGVIVPVLFGLLSGEQPTMLQAGGMLAAAAGIVLATKDRSETLEDRRRMKLSAGLALVAAISIGVGLTALNRAADAGVLDAVLLARLTSVAALVLAVAVIRPGLGEVVPRRKGLASIGVLDVAATCLYAGASTTGLLSVTALMSSLYPIVTILLARMVLSERVRRVQAVGIAAAVGGVLLMATG